MFARRFGVAVLVLASGMAGAADQRPDPAGLLAAQREAMAPLAALDGIWRGTATITRPGGAIHVAPHTERIGPFLDGSIKLIEGRSFKPDGTLAFNAFAILSYDPAARAYNFRSYAQGRAGDHAFRPTADGFVWESAAGSARIRYTTVIKDGAWNEVGERIEGGKPPLRFIELKLQRIGGSDWPGAGAIAPE